MQYFVKFVYLFLTFKTVYTEEWAFENSLTENFTSDNFENEEKIAVGEYQETKLFYDEANIENFTSIEFNTEYLLTILFNSSTPQGILLYSEDNVIKKFKYNLLAFPNKQINVYVSIVNKTHSSKPSQASTIRELISVLDNINLTSSKIDTNNQIDEALNKISEKLTTNTNIIILSNQKFDFEYLTSMTLEKLTRWKIQVYNFYTEKSRNNENNRNMKIINNVPRYSNLGKKYNSFVEIKTLLTKNNQAGLTNFQLNIEPDFKEIFITINGQIDYLKLILPNQEILTFNRNMSQMNIFSEGSQALWINDQYIILLNVTNINPSSYGIWKGQINKLNNNCSGQICKQYSVFITASRDHSKTTETSQIKMLGNRTKLPEERSKQILPGSLGPWDPAFTGTEIELDPYSQLYGSPGQRLTLRFQVTNWRSQSRFYNFACEDRLSILRTLQPWSYAIPAQQSIFVLVTVAIPYNTISDVDIITLHANSDNHAEKSTYLRISTQQPADHDQPEMTHRIITDCLNHREDSTCEGRTWSVEFTIRDSNSGLKTLESYPKGLRHNFISGSQDEVKAIYANSCCSRKVQIIAIDVAGNIRDYRVDIYVETSLSSAQIGLITVGVLLIIIIIVVIIVIAVVYRRKQKGSHDFDSSTGTHRTRL